MILIIITIILRIKALIIWILIVISLLPISPIMGEELEKFIGQILGYLFGVIILFYVLKWVKKYAEKPQY